MLDSTQRTNPNTAEITQVIQLHLGSIMLSTVQKNPTDHHSALLIYSHFNEIW